MRGSNQVARLALGLAIASALVVGCGSAVPSTAAPSARPAPVITPDPHLTEPATADEIFVAIRSGSLPLSVNNATAGTPNEPLVKRINAHVANWPLVISEFRSSAALREAIDWDPTLPPAQGDPPYAFVGLNILVEFGPVTGPLATPDSARREQAEQVIDLIDPLLWPLEQRAVVAIATRTPTAPPSASAAPAAPSAAASIAP